MRIAVIALGLGGVAVADALGDERPRGVREDALVHGSYSRRPVLVDPACDFRGTD